MNKTVSLILPYYNRIDYILPTLDSLEHFYKGRADFEIVIVDDQSNYEHKLDKVIKDYNLSINLIYIKNKKGINPCYPYNVGVRQSSGEIILLSSPEIVHTRNIFEACNNFENLNNKNYFQFSVFCLTDQAMKDMLMSRLPYSHKLKFLNKNMHSFYRDLGINGYSYANNIGAWYTHSDFQRNCYNFLSACTRDTYYALSGFDESYVYGTGYDDAEFRDRILKYVDNNVIWYDNTGAIHIDHPTVSSDNNTNASLYAKKLKYETNDNWGRL
jgi:glycosyltransferase involved in cell wall biosynthesis